MNFANDLSDPMLLWTHVYANALERPDEPVIIAGDKQVSFLQLASEAETLAAALHARGIKRGDIVSFQLPNWIEGIVLVLAMARIGAVANPIVTIYRRREVQFILRDTGSKMLFVPGVLGKFDHLALAKEVEAPELAHIVTVRVSADGHNNYESLLKEGGALPALPEIGMTPDDVAYIIYTSGTSGFPKGVKHSQRTLLSDSRASLRFADIAPGERNLVTSPITHITGLNHACFVPQLNSTAVVLLDEWRPDKAAQLIARENCVWMAGATPFLDGLLHHPDVRVQDLASLRIFRCGGAGVPPSIVREAATRGIEVTRCYGCTEVPTVSGITPSDAERNAITDGQVHYDVEMRVVALDDETRILGPNESGEILVRGPELFLGYTNAADTAAAMTPDGFFRTGDIGFLDADRFVTIVGRRKDIIIRKGENISAGEIEDILTEHPAIAQVSVIGLPDEARGEIVTAVCVAQRPDLSLADIVRFLEAAGLARQKFPERLELLSELPMTMGGKVKKNELREIFLSRVA